MPLDNIVVTLISLLTIAFLAWYFFGPKEASWAEIRGGSQELEITVKGGYSPDVIRVREGLPVRLIFNRQESSDCTARVVFPDFGVTKALPAFGKTVVEFTPYKSGDFKFACGMNMIHGALVVERAGTELPRAAGPEGGRQEIPTDGISAELQLDEDSEAASRRLECATLPGVSRREPFLRSQRFTP